MSVLLFLQPQNLADLAKREAARRKDLERQGIKPKLITQDSIQQRTGNLSQFSRAENKTAAGSGAKNRGSVKTYRDRLIKLDRDIRVTKDRIHVLRLRMASEKRARDLTIRTGRRQSSNPDRLHWQILELEAKLKRLERDRSDTYRAGIKAGFLPGELENRGIIP